MKKIVTLVSILTITSFIVGGNVSALTYSNSVDTSFTFNPTISVSLSSADLVINDLAPGTYSDSNVITVTTSTNSTGGYTLLASVGNSTYNSRNLTQSGVSDVFNSIDTDASLASLTTTNTWGYATSDNGTTWSTYSGLPLYNSTDITTGAKTLTPTTGQRGEGTISFKIAAYADSNISGGTYNNVINFIATAEPEPHYYIQDFTLAQCQTLASDNHQKVYDIRDEKDYTVRYINGACWMTQNLAIEPGTHMTANDTNITTAQYNNSTYYALPGSGYDLKNNASSASDNCYGLYSSGTYTGDGWTNACTHFPDTTDLTATNLTTTQIGAWYNYSAATAGTIIGASANTTTATKDICPKNWLLPSRDDDNSPIDSINNIIGYTSVFNPVYGGYYDSGTLYIPQTDGYWWSSTTLNYPQMRRTLRYENNNLDLRGNYYRYGGFYIRCVRTS